MLKYITAICIGTNGRMSVPSNRDHHYRNLKDRYTNCTYVDGNLELTWLQEQNLDLSFLQYIREVTGYVLISHVDIKRIVLPRLQIIRGRTLFKMNVRDEEFALIVTLSKMFNLELPALRDVLRGSVGLFNNYNLCHVKTINWKEIISDPEGTDIYVYNFTSPERRCSCHKDCKEGCWGDGRENCQEFSKETCSPQCFQGRCFGPNPRECCHLFCAGGCTGPKQSDCIACRNFYDDGVCKQECPPMQIYNPTTYSWEVNPEGKYAYGATCVKKCPEHLLKDNGACVRSCPPNKRAVDGECVPCDGPCPKACVGVGVIHSGNIDSFKGCTVLEGNLEILENSFKGFQSVYANFSFGERYSKMHPDRLEVFSTLKEITGYLNIQAYDNDFKNLSYFRNLEVIGGRALYEYSTSLYIVKTSLESFEMRSLRKINMGTVAILENKHLCFAEAINWDKIRKSHEHHLMLSNNSDIKSCKARGLVCDDQCSKDGCWGPGADECLSCVHYKLGNRCLQNCSVLPGIYRAENNECKPCHEQCGSSCHGPGADNCTTCKYYKDGPFCVSQCPTNKYEENGVCKQCHTACVDGCTGPKNTVGLGGCNSCELAIMNENATVDGCLHKNESCPDGYYFEYVGPHQDQESFLRSLSGKAICRKCHPRCKRCNGYGFHILICQECTNYKKGEQCEDECTMDYYPDSSTKECVKCDDECRGCTGPSPEDCSSCQNFKVFTSGNIHPNNSHFRCVATCPPEFPHRVFPEDGDSYCSDSDRDMVKSLASAMETSEGTSEGDEYLQPKSRAPLSATGLRSISSISPSPTPEKYWPSAQAMASDGSTSQYQNHLNQKLLRYAQSHGFDPSARNSESDGSSMRYCGESIKMRDDMGSDEYDSGRSQAQVGTLKLELPVDEDDYLMPSPQQTQGNSTYVDLIDSKNSDGSNSNIFRAYSDFYKNNIDNPEYLMNNDPPSQTIGLPTVSEFVHASTNASDPGFKPAQPYLPQRSSEEESDHEYYNDFDRLQRELQPLKKNKDGAIV
ncbi:hypothetical protein NQ315_004068 [Exocentrus adspersus]|uniref:receptor protein-tyrosine kinase n=1 Tax=Exocentrus adspersus TaxID=1586481 RepID=A0AAV8W6M8_9CUCU|nr:hypothetical protein NQ315_004068 [Exocentrus adspersus]